MNRPNMQTIKTIAACALLASTMGVFAHEPGNHAPAGTHGAAHAAPAQQAWGITAPQGAKARTIDVAMTDAMRFEPAHIDVRQGETVRLRVHNRGQAMHELVLGTEASLAEHAQMMRSHPGMPHDAPYMAHVPPGQSGTIVWTFNRPGQFAFACLVAGHFEAGMVGTLTVRPAGSDRHGTAPARDHSAHSTPSTLQERTRP